MLKSVERLPLSAINLVLLGAFVLGALIAGALGSWTGAAYLGFFGLGGLACALFARRPGSRDVTRLNALEWRDERDRTLAKSGFAVVGAVSLLMVLAQFLVVIVTDAGPDSLFMWVTLSQMVILYVAWGIANSACAGHFIILLTAGFRTWTRSIAPILSRSLSSTVTPSPRRAVAGRRV